MRYTCRRCFLSRLHSCFVNKLVRRLGIGITAVLIIFALLFISPRPTVPVQQRPSAEDIHAARQVWQQLKMTRGKAATEVRVENRMISGLSALARDATGVPRIEAILSEGELRGRASVSLPLGLWLNASASATGSHRGFPSYRLTVGRLPLPSAVGRPLADLARSIFLIRGARIPPLDELVQDISIERDHAVARVKLPSRAGLVDRVIAASSREISNELTQDIFCRIAAAQRAEPIGTLPELVRRTFAGGPGANPEGYNRASFVALSLAVLGERAEALLPGGAELRKNCAFPAGAVRLQGRADLAMHWVLSAGLTSVLGPQAAENLGEWKELDDSLPDGSGFSFVDLAADRAGVQTALLALDPQTAGATKKKLSRATDDYMLPEALLQAPEGLSDTSFVQRFGSLERKHYREAVSRIDRILAQQRRQPSPD